MTQRRPHHDGSPLYVSNDSPSLGEEITVRLRVPDDEPLSSVAVRSLCDGEPVWSQALPVATTGHWVWWEARITVHNPRQGYRWLLESASTRTNGSTTVRWVNQSGVHSRETLDAHDFAVVARAGTPAWFDESVVYQVFLDRFARAEPAVLMPSPDWSIPARWADPVDPLMPGRSHQLYGGNLDGVAEKLAYIASLGANTIYLTPFFPARSNHRYDAESFDRVDPILGGDAALIRLVDAAHELGIRVIGDLTTNHTGDNHEWFQAAFKNPGAPTEDYYFFDERNERYECWLGAESLPKLNWRSERLRREFITDPDSIVLNWLRPPYNLDGWRIDVANMTGRSGAIDVNDDVRRLIRTTMDRQAPGKVLIAEITNDATGDMQGDGWHSAMSYTAFTRPVWSWLCEPSTESWSAADSQELTMPWFFGQPVAGIPTSSAREFAATVDAFNAGLPWSIRRSNLLALGTHDTGRFRTHADRRRTAVAMGLAVSMPGVPMVFAGDELGLQGADGEASRTPMPWTSINSPDYADTIDLYRSALQLRREHLELIDGGFRWIHIGDSVVAFARESKVHSMLVVASSSAFSLALDENELNLPIDDVPVFSHGVTSTMHDKGASLSAEGPAIAMWTMAGLAERTVLNG